MKSSFNILRSPEGGDGAAPETPAQRAERLETENVALREQLAGNAKVEYAIRVKMAAGLSRKQAEASVRNQASFDALKAEQKAKAKKR